MKHGIRTLIVTALAGGRNTADALEEDFRLEHIYYAAASERFEKAVGDPGGSAYGYFWDCYNVEILDMGIVAKEELLHSMCDSTYVAKGVSSSVTDGQIEEAYAADTNDETDECKRSAFRNSEYATM